MNRGRELLPLLLAIALGFAPAPNAMADASAADFDIPSQPLGSALATFGEQAGVSVIASETLVHGKISHPVEGRMPPTDALRILLVGTLLEPTWIEDRAVAVQEAAGADPSEMATPPPAEPQSTAAVTRLEEITVTAEKMERSLQATALSVQAFDLRAMERMGLTRTSDIGRFTPGITMVPASTGGGQMSMSGRGAGNRDNHPLLPAKVGLYIDGSYIGVGNAVNLDLLDIDRIEVLKGPQGTLFGRNTIGGAISVITKKPDRLLGGSMQATAGTHGERSIRGSLNAPLVDKKLFGRIALVRKNRGPFFVNGWPGATKPYDDIDEYGARIALRWLATERITADWTFERIRHDNATPANQLVAVGAAPFDAMAPYVRSDNGNILTNAQRFSEMDLWQTTVTLTWDVFENMAVKSISGWRRYDQEYAGDADGTPLVVFENFQADDHRTFYQELQGIGTILDGCIDYAIGLTWFLERSDTETSAKPFAAFNAGTANFTTRTEGANRALGIYGQLTAHLTDRLEATVGVRLSKERREVERSRCNDPGLAKPASCPPGPAIVGDNFLGIEDRIRSDNWSPLFRVAYRWSSDVMTYLSWTRGYSSGGFNVRYGSLDDLAPYEDETVSQWEVGIKSEWLDNRLRANASAYYSEYRDMQVSGWRSTSSATYWSNAGGARIRGWEVDLTAAPIDELRLGVVHGWTKADFTEFEECPPGSPPGCTPIERSRFHRIPATPHRTYGGFVSYTFDPSSLGTFEISMRFHRQGPSGYHTRIDLYDASEGQRHTVYGARAELYDAFGVPGLSVAVVGSNITDRSYVDNGIDFRRMPAEPRFTMKTFGDPRHVMIEIGYAF